MSSENVIHCIQNVHVKELVKRLNWSVRIRWYYLLISTVMIVCAYFLLDDHMLNIHYDYLISANLFLILCNSIYQYQLRFSYDKCMGTFDLRFYLLIQIMTDYLALALVAYALGSIETPIILMIIPNTILATLFFRPWQSLLIALAGLLMVIIPLMLEYFQLIPMITIFEYSSNALFKNSVFSKPILIFGYVFILFSCVIFCWYLLCSITTRLIKNELELERSYQDMIMLDKEKTQAILRSTHELKAPLAAIKSYVYTMNSGYAGDINDKVLHIVDRIGKRCDYLLNNVTDIIKLGNLKSYVLMDKETDVQSKQFYSINMKQYMNDFISHNEALLCEKNLKISIDDQLTLLSEKNQCIVANEENLQLIFSNVLSNAVNYSHENGQIKIVLWKREKSLCVSIEDHGIGIGDEQLKKVFEENFRANNAAQFYEGGTGLGLSIVKICSQLIEAEVKIISTLNQGTIVTLCFKTGEEYHE